MRLENFRFTQNVNSTGTWCRTRFAIYNTAKNKQQKKPRAEANSATPPNIAFPMTTSKTALCGAATSKKCNCTPTRSGHSFRSPTKAEGNTRDIIRNAIPTDITIKTNGAVQRGLSLFSRNLPRHRSDPRLNTSLR